MGPLDISINKAYFLPPSFSFLFRCSSISWFQDVTKWVSEWFPFFTASPSTGLSELFTYHNNDGGTMLMMPFLAFPAVRPRLLWPQLAQEGWDASRKEPDGRWSDWKYSNLEAKNITSYIVQESSSLKLFAWLLKKPDCTLAKTQGEGVKKSIYILHISRSGSGGVSHLGPDRKEMWKFWPIFSIVFWFFDTQNTLNIIVKGLKYAFLSVLNKSAILLFDDFVTEQQQTVCRKNWGY